MRRSQPGKSPTAGESVSSSPHYQLFPARLVAIKEVAQAMTVSVKTVYRLIEDGELPSFRIGKVIRIRPQDVDAYLNRVKASDESASLDHFIHKQIRG